MYKYYKHSNIVESMPQCANIQLVSKHIRLKDRVLLNLTGHWKSLYCFTKTQIYSLKFLTLEFPIQCQNKDNNKTTKWQNEENVETGSPF